MEIVFGIVQSMGISLGVGCSTMAILHFFSAIADGIIDETERNFMGLTYIVLRVAMGIILVSSIALATMGYLAVGESYFTSYVIAQALLVAILFINAILMTKHFMPSTFGPAIQASTWYTLGFMMAVTGQLVLHINFFIFVLAYLTLILFAISLVNSVMAYLKAKREG
ncbi:MAG TPA: hypothetical protein PKD95_02705 [Candidatus Paceibacterota bacterium]|nr:hypothetical protein [Candidatus Paceibacterota bacterium]